MSVSSDLGAIFLLPFHLHQDQKSLNDHVFDHLNFLRHLGFYPAVQTYQLVCFIGL